MLVITWFSYSVLAHLLSFEPNHLSILWKAIASNRASVHRAGNVLATKEMLVQTSSPAQNWGKHLGLSCGLIIRLLALLWWGFLLWPLLLWPLTASWICCSQLYGFVRCFISNNGTLQILKNLPLEIFQSDLRLNNLSCYFILSEDVSGSLWTQRGMPT